MVINLDFKKVGDFISDHKEAVAVALVSTVLLKKRNSQITNMQSFIHSYGLSSEYRKW